MSETLRKWEIQFEQDQMANATPEMHAGKALLLAIKSKRKDYMSEFDAMPNLVLIHPGDMSLINHYCYKTTVSPYIYDDDVRRMFTIPDLEVLLDYRRERGTFLVTRRNLMDRSGIVGNAN